MSLAQLHEVMDWPGRREVLSPSGAGPRVLVELAKAKIEAAIRRATGGRVRIKVGLLTKNPYSQATQAPIAVVCEFGSEVPPPVLALAHRLAWNFARTPLLVTIEPHLVRAWTCCEPPADEPSLLEPASGEIREAELDLRAKLTPSEQAAHALHWVRLASGDFFQRFPERFRRDGRADRILLKELTGVRRRLQRQGLDDDTIHDLLARVVFVQFLFDRKDADGRPALNSSLLAGLHEDGVLRSEHQGLATILGDYQEAYRFFRWLNEKFNGDLFPGKGRTAKEREAEWRDEMSEVKPEHLQTLADFVGGRMRDRQWVLWRQYSFDVIPLEFISSIYEEFVTAAGAHYTPPYLVDFILDEVLPWDSDQWDLKILDPACGSGIFLVKAYQRLVQRWKNAHRGQKPPTAVLKRLLERNLLGVDIDPHGVRVASFSLYLTMCDEIDPKTYLKNTKFPRLRGTRLLEGDFFQEDVRGFSTAADGPTYDLVVGNAPWGKKTETPHARSWAQDTDRQWPIPNDSIGTLLLPKAASLTKPAGRIAMIQPASSLLFNRSGPANRFREKFFAQFKVEEIVNLSTLRFELFENATSPPCIVTMRPTGPDDEPLRYVSPKQVNAAGGAEVSESSYAIIIEPHDVSQVWPDEAATDPLVWTALAWGGRRDVEFVRRLRGYQSLLQLEEVGEVSRRKGIVRGNQERALPLIKDRPILDAPDFPTETFLFLDARQLPRNDNEFVDDDDSVTVQPFQLPQLILKKSWKSTTQRVHAAVVDSDPQTGAVVCTQSYVAVHTPPEYRQFLEAACLAYNSVLAVYYLLLSSGRLASYRPEPLVEEVLSMPMPAPGRWDLRRIRTLDEVDREVREAFACKDAEWVLVEDVLRYTMADFKGDDSSPGRQATERDRTAATPTQGEPCLSAYCRYFLRVLKAGFGQDKAVCATIYQDDPHAPLPVRLVAIHLGWPGQEDIVVEPIDTPEVCKRLTELDAKLLSAGRKVAGGMFYQRVARIYDEFRHGRRSIPTVYIVKPDRVRYWTRSAALRDADEVAADVALWARSPGRSGRGHRPT